VYDLSQRLATFWDVHYRCGFGLALNAITKQSIIAVYVRYRAEHALEFDGVNAYVNLLVETALNQYSRYIL
jgi:hypothetical protein